jgi:hypothetical protein
VALSLQKGRVGRRAVVASRVRWRSEVRGVLFSAKHEGEEPLRPRSSNQDYGFRLVKAFYYLGDSKLAFHRLFFSVFGMQEEAL